MKPEQTKKNWPLIAGVALVISVAAAGLGNLMHMNNAADNVAQQGSVLAQSSRHAGLGTPSPQELYHQAWELIHENFYKRDFNNQEWSRWEHHYDGKLKTAEDAYKGIETMLASLGDPYTRFLNKEAFTEEKSQIDAHLFGVGMQLGMNKEHKVLVIAPIEGTPAYMAGVRPGDEIIEVDSKPVKGQSLDQVVKQIRGPRDTAVAITILRTNDKAAEKIVKSMKRAEIPIKAVANAEMLPGGIGYVRLDSFISRKANEEMREALTKLSAQDAHGLILDLRNNPGGLLSNAIDIANMFLEKGIIVSTIDNEGYKNSQPCTRQPRCDLPMVVLINGGSASASEILSGALRDNGRAKLVGQKSFGKGLVQAINKLKDESGINVTIARYLTPNDTDIHKTGIIPDFTVELKEDDYKANKGPWWIDTNYTNFKHSPADGKDIQLSKAVEVLKKEMAVATSNVAAGNANAAPASGKN